MIDLFVYFVCFSCYLLALDLCLLLVCMGFELCLFAVFGVYFVG